LKTTTNKQNEEQEMNTIIIATALAIIIPLCVYALKCAKREDDQIENIQRRLKELENDRH